MPTFIFHLIGTAHIDPVWLWDSREGLNEGLITCRANLNLMDEDPEVTFCRGEAAIYEHILHTDPALFERIKTHVKTGRWEVIGGTYVQSDENLPDTEALIRQYTRGQRFFQKHFGQPVTTGWSADCFGHTAGLPAILNAAGLTQFMFTRPLKPECPLPGPAFWWEGPGNSQVLTYRPHCDWYCIERNGLIPRLEQTLTQAKEVPQQHVAVMYGLGNHGGGPTKRHLREIRDWGKNHPEVEMRFSTHNRFFAALREEMAAKGDAIVGRHRGEIQACERGVYTSMAKLKFLYRRTHTQLTTAEATDAAISATLHRPTTSLALSLTPAWDSLLFNSFHDILPGTCIERAADSQITQLGQAYRTAETVTFHALNALAQQIDTRVQPPAHDDAPTGVAFLVYNPLPVPFDGLVELEGSMDWRPIWKYEGRPDDMPVRLLNAAGENTPFQSIALESKSHMPLPWRKRVVAPVQIPAMGWTIMELGYFEGATPPAWPDNKRPASFTGDGIENEFYRVEAWVGGTGIRVRHKGKDVFGPLGFRAETYEDPWGSWGGPEAETTSWDLATVAQTWTVTQVRMIEKGPHRASLWVRLEGKKSRLDLTFQLAAGREAIDIQARVFWDQPNERLKLVFPGSDTATFEVPGDTVTRGPKGDVPGRRWIKTTGGPTGGFTLITDSLSGFDCRDGALKASVVRSSAYAYYGKTTGEWPWLPAIDSGELKFTALLAPPTADAWALAERLDKPVSTLPIQAKAGPLPRTGSLLKIEPAGLRLLAFKPSEDGQAFILRLQSTAEKPLTPTLTLANKKIPLTEVPPGAIASWRITEKDGKLLKEKCDATELA